MIDVHDGNFEFETRLNLTSEQIDYINGDIVAEPTLEKYQMVGSQFTRLLNTEIKSTEMSNVPIIAMESGQGTEGLKISNIC